MGRNTKNITYTSAMKHYDEGGRGGEGVDLNFDWKT